MEFLRKTDRIKTRKATRGLWIKVLKYDEFQLIPEFYGNPTETPKRATQRATENKHESNAESNSESKSRQTADQQETSNTSEIQEKYTTKVAKQSFAKEIYLKIHLAYKETKGVEPKGKEWDRIDRAIKCMLESNRVLEEIIACIEWFGWAAKQDNKRYEWTKSWTMETVAKKLPEFLAGKLERSDRVPVAYLKKWNEV